MRGIQCKLSAIAPNFQYCHQSLPISSNTPFLRSPCVSRLSTNTKTTATAPLQITNLSRRIPWKRQRPLGVSIAAAAAVMASSTLPSSDSKPFSVLFVCLGNICRSPAAEGVFRGIVKQKELLPKFRIDSAGTINYHEGNEADQRMRTAANKRGIDITSISRPIRPSDFRDFDLILAMDMQNRDDIFEAFNRWKTRESLPDDAYKKVKLMCSYCKKHKETEVPDPYFGGPSGFEKVLDILEDACGSLFDSIVVENGYTSQSS